MALRKYATQISLERTCYKKHSWPWLLAQFVGEPSGSGLITSTFSFNLFPQTFLQGTHLGCWFSPRLGCGREATDWCFPVTSMFLSLSLSLSLFLSPTRSLKAMEKKMSLHEEMKERKRAETAGWESPAAAAHLDLPELTLRPPVWMPTCHASPCSWTTEHGEGTITSAFLFAQQLAMGLPEAFPGCPAVKGSSYSIIPPPSFSLHKCQDCFM